MTTRKEFLAHLGAGFAAAAVASTPFASALAAQKPKYTTLRPVLAKRHFTSKAVEAKLDKVKSKIKDPKLAWMFENCYPNTLDTTVDFKMEGNRPDTFVITGDIDAMWLRDSAAQVWPYVELCNDDEQLKLLIAGVVNRQMKCILLDRYANAFTKDKETDIWADDMTDMKPFIHERKWEIDSLCYPIRLAYHYWKVTGDTSIFDENWTKAMNLVYQTFVEQQRKDGTSPYTFQRITEKPLDSMTNHGMGNPFKPNGLIFSAFRPSDDATTFGFLIPSNLFAVSALNKLAEISNTVTGDKVLADKATALANEVSAAIKEHAVVDHPKYGKVYAFEADGFGNVHIMDDANVPSLLALPYLDSISKDDPIYQNTRKLVWSDSNPYFFKGSAISGIGGPHVGYDMVWPMSLIMKAQTSDDDNEIRECLRTLRDTDAETGFMHESVHKDDPKKFSRSWFAWVNTLFGELIVKLYDQGKIGLLNSL